MNITRRIIGLMALLALWICAPWSPSSFAQETAFSYQGRLNDGQNPANGLYDLRFTVFNADANGEIVSGPITNAATPVNAGLFTVMLDLSAGVFSGPGRWLELQVKTNGAGAFTPVFPRQRITAAPYSVVANSASNLLGTLPAAQLSGAITVESGPGNTVNLSGALAINGTTIIDATGNWIGPSTGLAGPQGPPGPRGANGNTILNGTNVPSSTNGLNGDFYLNTSSSKLYGPKTVSGWGTGVSLIGPSLSTSAVCVTASSTSSGDCNCSGGRVVSKVTTIGNYGQCTATADSGSCTAYGYLTFYHGSCCVCAPN